MDELQLADDLLSKSGNPDPAISVPAMAEIAKAVTEPLRKGVMSGDITDGIFEVVPADPKNPVYMYPLDVLAPGTEKDHVAYTIPNQGRIPERSVEGDYVMIPTFKVGNSIDWLLDYAEQTNWNIVGRYMEIFEAGFVKKMNNDAWHLLLSAAVDRNIIVYDSDANAGQFTKRLASLTKITMRRNGGGNSTSIDRRKLTDLFISPEGFEDIRNWGIDQVDEVTRREIFVAGDGKVNQIFDINLHDLDELGEGQEYQLYFQNELSGSMPSGDLEIGVGFDLSRNDSFIMPVSKKVEVFPDPTLHRQQRAGVYGWTKYGVAALDNRSVILISY